MAFIKRDVKDRVVQYPRRYQLVEVQPGIFDLIPVTGTVTEEGTPINKAYLQPIEDGLENALEKTGDGKDVTVTFSEADTEAHIASGEKLSTMFGKILKKFKSVAPKSHASSANTYGVGTTANYGHCKTINGLTQASHVNGNALSAYQGKVLDGKINNKMKKTLVRTITRSSEGTTQINDDFSSYDFLLFELTGSANIENTETKQAYMEVTLTGDGDDISLAWLEAQRAVGVPTNISNIQAYKFVSLGVSYRVEPDGVASQEMSYQSLGSTGELPLSFKVSASSRAQINSLNLTLTIYGFNY